MNPIEIGIDGVPDSPGFVSMRVLPDRALMIVQARARLPDGPEVDVFWSPPDAMRAFGGTDDFMGNASFSFGGAVLAPYANRIRGRFSPQQRTVAADIGGRLLSLPANGGGKAEGAEKYAIHGLILARRAEEVRLERESDTAQVTGRIRAGDFGVGWPSSTDLEIRWELRRGSLSLTVTAENVGHERTPIGLGWHPYFALPSGRREQARMRIPARSRVAVNNYDEVLPTGDILPVRGTSFDFQAAGGALLPHGLLDDCFVDIERSPSGATVCEVIDPAARYGLRITARSPQITAIQTFADPNRPFVVIEPQFNVADPFGKEWAGKLDTRMVWLEPSERVEYAVRLELFTPPIDQRR